MRRVETIGMATATTLCSSLDAIIPDVWKDALLAASMASLHRLHTCTISTNSTDMQDAKGMARLRQRQTKPGLTEIKKSLSKQPRSERARSSTE
jgi:hypothetical protein